MADLTCRFFSSLQMPNPFVLASGPPTDKAVNVERAYRAGWGGVVWKTVTDPEILNVSGPRYAALYGRERSILGMNNIELISDRPLAVNLQEITQVKRAWPNRALIVSAMAPCVEEEWARLLQKIAATGADGIELNFGCPHGMSERGMGSVVGQDPVLVECVTRWAKAHTRLPVMVKLTPNVMDIRLSARAAWAGGADAVSLINTINAVMGVDLDRMVPFPSVGGQSTHGGYCGPAVKPIALHMLAEVAKDSKRPGTALSGMGGITTWRDAVEFLSLGAGMLQICSAAMIFGFSLVVELCTGLAQWMDEKGYAQLEDVIGRALPQVVAWKMLDLETPSKAFIHQEACIQCGRCYAACEDTAHQAILKEKEGRRHFEVLDTACVGCALCACVCPIEGCIEMVTLPVGARDPRTGATVPAAPHNWERHPKNPEALASKGPK